MKKITRATFKSFIKRERENNNLYIKVKSSFSGMTDMVEEVKDNFEKVEDKYNEKKKYDLGIHGIWLVGSSRDWFEKFADDKFIGYEVSNCCGSFIVAMKRLY